MRPPAVGRIGAALVIIAVAETWNGAQAARADDAPSESVRVDFTAPATCPSRDAFLASVRARTARMRVVSTTEPERTFAVVLEDAARGARGHVTIRDRNGQNLRRDVAGASCEEVADVLALVVALAIDPHASITPHVAGVTAPVASASASAPSSIVTPPSPEVAPSATPPSAPLVPAPSPEYAPPATRRPTARTEKSTVSWATGAGAIAATGVTPSLLFGPSVFVEARVGQEGWLAPRIRASFERTASGRLDVSGGSARFIWTVARVDGCVAGWRAGSLRFSPCVDVEAGVLGAAGADVDHARSAARPWLALGPLARTSWTFLDPLFVELDVSAHVALARSQFFFEPNANVYTNPLLGVGVGLWLGASF